MNHRSNWGIGRRKSLGRRGVLVFSLGSAWLALACGGRTATGDDSSLDDGLLIDSAEVLEVTNQNVPGVGTTAPGVTPSTGTTPSTGSVPNPPRPQPTAPGRPPRPTPTTTPTPSVTSGPITTITAPTSPTDDSTSPPTSSSEITDDTTWSTTSVPTDTTSNWTTEPNPTTTDVTSEPPPPPFDPLHPPDGQVALGLPPEYADAIWYDIDSPKCTTNYGWAGTFYCSESTWCDDAGSTYIDCEATSSGDWSCSCNDFEGFYSAIVVPSAIVPADDTRQACRIGTAICVSDVPAMETSDCQDSESGSTSYCSRTRVCSDSWHSSYGDFRKDEQSTNVTCYTEQSDSGEAICQCSGVAGYMAFDLASSPSSVCEVGLDVCVVGVDESSLGPVECEWARRDIARTSCSQDYTCTQQGTSNEAVVSASGQANVNCYQLDDGSWGCYCSYDEPLEPIAAEDSAAACDIGGELCIGKLTRLFY